MLDWDTYAGNDPLPLDPTWAPKGEVDWLPQPAVKGGFDEFGPMFGSEGAGNDGGATDVGDVIVIGERPDEPWWDIDNLPGGGGDGGGGPGSGAGGGGGGGEGPTQREGHQGEDCATAAIRDEINSRPTNNTAEHSAAVYKGADGRYHTTPVFDGAGGTAPVVQLIEWLLSNGVGFNQLTSVYHNHDDAHVPNDSTNIAVNRYPSHLFASNGTGDWAVAELFVNPHSSLGQIAGADPNVFKLTIEDTNGVARDFAYADKEKYKALTKEEMEAGKDLPGAETGCGAG